MVRLRPWLLSAVVLGGCPSQFAPGPCDIDPVGCKNTYGIAQTCQLAGSLQVELGTGETAFQAVDAAHPFVIHHGLQGGEHTFVAIRVRNPALDHPQLGVSLQVLDATGEAIGLRQLALGPPLPVVSLAEPATQLVEQAGIAVFGSLLETGVRINLTVTDPCGRTGTASVPFPK